MAFVLGYLTHVAADQHIHPFVERYAGSFCVSGRNRKKHRTLEVYQFLYKEKYPDKDFFEENFPAWIGIGPPVEEVVEKGVAEETTEIEKKFPTEIYTFEWFRSFIQREFFGTYSSILEENEIEKWIKGFNSIFRAMPNIGPYYGANKNIRDNTEEANEFRKMFYAHQTNYLAKYFELAKRLSERYILIANNFFTSKFISESEKNEFLAKIPDADLTSPLADL